MPLISVVTAAYAPSAAYLAETAHSIATQDLPPGWEVEWVVQEDGDNPSLRERLGAYPFARYAANNGKLMISATRNLALSRAAGTLVQALDADDLLLPGAFTTLIPLFEQHPIHWAVGQADDLMPDGSRKSFNTPIPFGVLKAGWVNNWAIDRGANWPIHCAAIMVRATSWRALGGWTGIPYDDEIATFAALSEITDGYHHGALTWLYRQHDRQTHRTEDSITRSEECRRIAAQRARSIRAAGLAIDHNTLRRDGDGVQIHVGPARKEQAEP